MRVRSPNARTVFVVLLLCSVLFFARGARAQGFQFWPEVDAHVGLAGGTRLWVQADRLREEGAPTQTEIGPSLELSVRPLLRLRKFVEQRPDLSQLRALTLTMGYRYLVSPGKAAENRFVFEASPRFPFSGKILLEDRNRSELRFIAGSFFWRYRNRVTLERPLSVHLYSFSPYVRSEGFYDSRYGKWSATTLSAGAIFPIKRRAEVEPYYQHQNQSGCTPNQQAETFGLKLSLYFQLQKE